jgi:hypothetical protein
MLAAMNDSPSRRAQLKQREHQILKELCLGEGVRVEFMERMLELERRYLGYERRRNFWPQLEELFDAELTKDEP